MYTLLMIMCLLSIYTTNLFFLWMFLEILSMSFVIYLNMNSIKIYSIMYYMIANISSTLIMISILSQFHLMDINITLLFSLWLKLGMFPLNNWMNLLMKNINYNSLMLLLTLMKVIPLLMFMYFIKFNTYIFTLMLIMMIPPVIFSLNTSSYPMLMNYSSMYNIPLILIFNFTNNTLVMTYMISYITSTFYVLFFLNSHTVYYKNSLNLNINKNHKIFINLMMFIYAQFPPFFTFTMKWNLISYTLKTNNNFILASMMMIMCSLIITFSYLNFNNYNYYLNHLKIGHKINIKMKNNFMLKLMLNITFLSLTLVFSYMYMY
uniref:NADH-ubiquinone oxidoreductase chain 2 n=1 Tax=Lasioglossum punctatissimum TaxID=1040140 RepID=A0A0S2LSB9_9HYME|nr:NADH dehydrogenase subunit 2 [Lasioglossum punctatissimum]